MNLSLVAVFSVLAAFILVGVTARKADPENPIDLFSAAKKARSLNIGSSLFTLIGAGEIVTLSTLAFIFGFSGLYLFLGYALAFIVMGAVAPYILRFEAAAKSTSLVDFCFIQFGEYTGYTMFLISLLAFFSLLMLQFATLGVFLPEFAGLNRELLVGLIGLCIFIYAYRGGLRAVFRTDVFQAILMFILLAVLIVELFRGDALEVYTSAVDAPFAFTWGLAATGFFVALVSADVWQRLLAAESNQHAQVGFGLGAVALLVYGALICFIGIAASNSFPDGNPEEAFFLGISASAAADYGFVVVILLMAALVSTADTEIFLLTSMISRQVSLSPTLNEQGVLRWLYPAVMACVIAAAVLMGLIFDDLIAIYTWLLFLLLGAAPPILLGLIGLGSDKSIAGSAATNVCGIAVVALSGFLSLENIYWAIPFCIAVTLIFVRAETVLKKKFN